MNINRMAPTVQAALPSFAKQVVNTIADGQIPDGFTKGPLDEASKQEAGKGMFAASMLAGMDEKAGQDQAMGQPGVVTQGPMTATFVSAGPQQIEAVINSPSKDTGEPATLYVSGGPNGLQSIGVLEHSDSLEVRSVIMTSQTDGYVLVGQIKK